MWPLVTSNHPFEAFLETLLEHRPAPTCFSFVNSGPLLVISFCFTCFTWGNTRQAGQKRRRDDERQAEGQEQEAGAAGEQQESSDVEVEELEVEGQASASSEPRPPSTFPLRGPPLRAPKISSISIDPPPRWDLWSLEWCLYFTLGRVNRRLQPRGQVMENTAQVQSST